MAQEHGDRLTAVDASFLAQEGPTSHMHVGAVLIFEGPPPAYDDFADHIRGAAAPRAALPPEARLPAARDGPAAVGRRPELQPRVPRAPHGAARARLRGAAARARRARSTPSGSTAPSRCGRRGSSQGLEGGRFALISKTHHALVDGIAGVDLVTVLFDLDAGAAADAARGRAVGAAARAERGSSMAARGVARAARSCRSSSPAARGRRGDAPGGGARRGARGARGRRRGRLGRPEPGARRRR